MEKKTGSLEAFLYWEGWKNFYYQVCKEAIIVSAEASLGSLNENPRNTNSMEIRGQGTQSENSQVDSCAKPPGRIMLFRYFWNFQCLNFTPISVSLALMQETLREYSQVKNILNVEFRESAEDFHPCIIASYHDWPTEKSFWFYVVLKGLETISNISDTGNKFLFYILTFSFFINYCLIDV